MAQDISNKYFVKRGSQEFATISQLFTGVRILKVDGFTSTGEAKNIYTESWVNSQTEDYMVTTKKEVQGNMVDVVIRNNVDLEMTFIVGTKYGAVDVRNAHDAFIAYMTDGELYIKSEYVNRTMRCVCLKEYKPTTIKLQRGNNSYIMGTLVLHTLDSRAGDDDGYISNPYPTTSGGDTPTPSQQILSSNVYDTSLGATQASLNQRYESTILSLSEKADKSDTYTKVQVNNLLSQKQDNIADLDVIRTGASKGRTSLQEISQEQFNSIFN